MDLTRILFVSDTHLGFDLPRKPRIARRRRGPDFFDNFNRALEPARRREVDLVIHRRRHPLPKPRARGARPSRFRSAQGDRGARDPRLRRSRQSRALAHPVRPPSLNTRTCSCSIDPRPTCMRARAFASRSRGFLTSGAWVKASRAWSRARLGATRARMPPCF